MKIILQLYFILSVFFCSSCKKFLDVPLDDSKIESKLVFSSDITATAAINGIYYNMISQTSFASGAPGSVSIVSALSSDELYSHYNNENTKQLNNNALQETNETVLQLWVSMYKTIYEANAVLEGLGQSTEVTLVTKKQLEAEATFLRAFCHFYLVNLFGDVPLITTADYRQNTLVPRTPAAEVYAQIVKDLQFAQSNLSEDYASIERVRPNKATATALLARVYLYIGEWGKAADASSAVIGNSNYDLAALDEVFKLNSSEAIWQLRPGKGSNNTWEGFYLILTTNPVINISNETSNVITEHLFESFEPTDNRKSKWIGIYEEGLGKWPFAYKYKIQAGGPGSFPAEPLVEYSMVFRLAEQYLIRAEARAQLNDISGAKSDIDVIRERAGLLGITAIDRPGLLLAIEKERRSELFTEWGHRWLDLKRWNKATAELGTLKAPYWQASDVLYPLPRLEMNRNPKLVPQNSGY